jgi:serine phosphatase RsbU (regulator of sigma subunit)
VLCAQKAGYHIRNYSPKEYKGFNQVWQAVQDYKGYIYFAGTTNVFVYSGQFWETIPVKSGAATRQICLNPVDSLIYIGSVGEFGYLDRDKRGKWNFISLISQLTEEQRSFNDVWKVYPFQGYMYFQSSERIFKLEGRKITKVIEASQNHGFALSFISNGHFYVRQRNIGLMEIINDKLVPVAGGSVFGEVRVLSIIPFSKTENLILTGDQGFVRMSLQPDPVTKSCFVKGTYFTDEHLNKAGVLGAKWINDSVMVVNSRAGIAIYSRDGKLKEILDKSCGLSDESIADVFLDREENIWLMHNSGISCIAYNSPALLYDDKIGYTGTIDMVHIFKDRLYLCTSDGMFKAKPQDPMHPNSLEMAATSVQNTEVWDVKDFKDHMLISSSEGLLRMKDEQYEQLTNNYTNNISFIPGTDYILTAEKNGLSIIDLSLQEPQIIKHYELPGQELMQIGNAEPIPQKPGMYSVWTTTRFKHIMYFEFGIKDSVFIQREYGPDNGVTYNNYYLTDFNDSIYFCTADSCFRYLPSLDKSTGSKCFANASDVFKKLAIGDGSGLKPPFNNKLFFLYKDSVTLFGHDKQGKMISRKIKTLRKFLELTLNYATILPDGKLMMVLDNLIMTYDTKKSLRSRSGFYCDIQSVSVGNDSMIFFGGRQGKDIPEIPYTKNRIAFHFQSPFFHLGDALAFSYRLDGYDTAWSKQTPETEKEFSNLPEGNYTFRVKAYNALGQSSGEAVYSFVIATPWYRSTLAYVFYALVFFLILYFTVKVSAYQLRKQKDKLEAMVKERTAEVMSQKQMLETAYGEIKDSIRYAKRIQNALLASDKLLKEYLKEYFIYYKPKDIVSGDFYWAHPKGDWLYMITADCTGHGVPGAFMSLLNISFLNETINTTSFVTPNDVLGEVRAQIIEALRSDGSEEGGKDGMDCVLCAYNFKSGELLFSAANNPLWVCRNKTIIEYKPDKFPVGKHDRENEPFRLQRVDLLPGDIVYTFTDGYADQFGGASGKKFKVKQLKELLLSIAHLPMNEQKDVVSKTLRKWKKGIDQIDDILIVGVRIQ